MQLVIDAYSRALATSGKTPANAFSLQRTLFELGAEFGSLYKYDNFRCFFQVAPDSCESVDFCRFWKGELLHFFYSFIGLEDCLKHPDGVIPAQAVDHLNAQCFMDDACIKELRVFRDELLLAKDSLGRSSEFLNLVTKHKTNSFSPDFWTLLIERCVDGVAGNHVSQTRVSDAIYGWLCRRFPPKETDKQRPLFATVSTCVSLNEDVTIPTRGIANKAADCDTEPATRITSETNEFPRANEFEYKYRSLLTELEDNLPSFYDSFASARDECVQLRSQVDQLRSRLESAHQEYALDIAKLNNEIEEMKVKHRKVTESNQLLKDELDNTSLMLDSARLQVQFLGSDKDKKKEQVPLDSMSQEAVTLPKESEREDIPISSNDCKKLGISVGTDPLVLETKRVDGISTATQTTFNIKELEDKLQRQILDYQELTDQKLRLDQEYSALLATLNSTVPSVEVSTSPMLRHSEIEYNQCLISHLHGKIQELEQQLEAHELPANDDHGPMDFKDLSQIGATLSPSKDNKSVCDRFPSLEMLQGVNNDTLSMVSSTMSNINDLDASASASAVVNIQGVKQDNSTAAEVEKSEHKRLAVTPALAEIRRLCAINSERFGHLNPKESHAGPSSGVVQRAIKKLQHSKTILEDVYVDVAAGDASPEPNSSDSEAQPDIFQSAADFITKKLFQS